MIKRGPNHLQANSIFINVEIHISNPEHSNLDHDFAVAPNNEEGKGKEVMSNTNIVESSTGRSMIIADDIFLETTYNSTYF